MAAHVSDILSWAKEQKRYAQRLCLFCSLPEAAHAELARLFAAVDKGDVPLPTQRQVHTWFVERHGYRGTVSAFRSHCAGCLQRGAWGANDRPKRRQ